MAEPYLSEIRLMSFVFAPKNWALCNGQLLPINQNQPLFALLGTTYGGNGQTTFALPDLRGRTPIHKGAGFTLGERGGQEAHTVTQSEMPAHLHRLEASSSAGNSPVPTGNVLAANQSSLYAPAGDLVALTPDSITNVGGSQPHQNMQPYLTLSFCIALAGDFPSQS